MAEREAEERRTGMRLRGRKPSPPEPAKERQANVTDPDSKIMKTQHGFIQGYNGQAVVTEHQIVIAADLTDEQTDSRLLLPMLDRSLSVRVDLREHRPQRLEALAGGTPLRPNPHPEGEAVATWTEFASFRCAVPLPASLRYRLLTRPAALGNRLKG